MTRWTPALTVVTPTFNAARFIEGCLDSVAGQDRPDVEHLIVDGGSTDGTVEIVQQRRTRDSRVQLISAPDNGQSHAMNKGVIAARAPLLGLLNVDDRYRSGTLAYAIAQLSETPEPSFLWGACEVRNHGPDAVGFLSDFAAMHDADGTPYWIQYPGTLSAWRLALGWRFEQHPANPSSYFYHRSLHFVAGLYEEENHYTMDFSFLLAAAPHIKHVITSRRVLGLFNLDIGSKTYDASTGAVTPRFESPVRARVIRELPLWDRARFETVRARRRLANVPIASKLWNFGKFLIGR